METNTSSSQLRDNTPEAEKEPARSDERPLGLGVLYIAFGEAYRKEALISMASVRSTSPGVGIAVITDTPWPWEPKPDHVLLRPGIFSLESKPRYAAETPFASTLLLDTDTFVCRDLSLGFGLLRRYDVLVQWGGNQFNHGDGLEFHARACSGAMFYRKSSQVLAVLAEWDRLYRIESMERGMAGIADERALTVALAMASVRTGALPSFFHVNLTTPWVFNSPPVILHGRFGDLQRLSRRLADGWNQLEDWMPRIWLPGIRGLLLRGIRRSDPLLAASFALRRFLNERWLGMRK